ncbi:DUF2267 domain-containing protein [Streptomyces sp. NPDC057445]|uniref:DUF2267 domain-containing protein n=1 Tax=Streptomyces sp. NPDC057445 TaxID=3346136 RepID=UPI0036A40ED7
MVDKANRLLKDVEEAFEWPKQRRKQSYAALRAVLHAPGSSPGRDGRTFGAELPTIVRGVYYDGWKPAETPVKMSNEEFFARVGANSAMRSRRQREAGAYRTEISGAPYERRRMATPQIPGADLVCRAPAVIRAEEMSGPARPAGLRRPGRPSTRVAGGCRA